MGRMILVLVVVTVLFGLILPVALFDLGFFTNVQALRAMVFALTFGLGSALTLAVIQVKERIIECDGWRLSYAREVRHARTLEDRAHSLESSENDLRQKVEHMAAARDRDYTDWFKQQEVLIKAQENIKELGEKIVQLTRERDDLGGKLKWAENRLHLDHLDYVRGSDELRLSLKVAETERDAWRRKAEGLQVRLDETIARRESLKGILRDKCSNMTSLLNTDDEWIMDRTVGVGITYPANTVELSWASGPKVVGDVPKPWPGGPLE